MTISNMKARLDFIAGEFTRLRVGIHAVDEEVDAFVLSSFPHVSQSPECDSCKDEHHGNAQRESDYEGCLVAWGVRNFVF